MSRDFVGEVSASLVTNLLSLGSIGWYGLLILSHNLANFGGNGPHEIKI